MARSKSVVWLPGIILFSLLLVTEVNFSQAENHSSSSNVTCISDSMYPCDDGACILKSWRCDGDEDCRDASDEKDCNGDRRQQQSFISEEHNCTDTEFKCARASNVTTGLTHTVCVPKPWLCDGTPDCPDNSDENPLNCGNITKRCEMMNMTSCRMLDKNGEDTCITSRWLCDGTPDCPNGYDELDSTCNKTTETFCAPDQFYCEGETNLKFVQNVTCIPLDRLCDGHNDCPKAEDEGINCNRTCDALEAKMRRKCQYKCQGYPRPNVPGGEARCTCPPTMQIDKNNKAMCEDIDECARSYGTVCSQICYNVYDGFDCLCAEGYRLAGNGSCKAESGVARLIFSSQTEIRAMDLYENDFRSVPLANRLNSNAIEKAIGVDFDGIGDRLYWTDVQRKVIGSASLSGSHTNFIQLDDNSQPEDVAVDYMANNIYYSDFKKQHIGVCTTDGLYCQTLLSHKEIEKPRGITVHPPSGLLVYTDWGTHAHIGKAGMDGANRSVIIREGVKWPNGVAIDIPTDRIFWGDAFHDLILSVKLDGTGKKVVKAETTFMMQHPFGIAVFEDTVYFSDWGMQNIQSCNKFTGKDHKVIVQDTKVNPQGLTVFHSLLKPFKYSPCVDTKCSHMCLVRLGGDKYTCKCPIGMYLEDDGFKCHKNKTAEILIQEKVDDLINLNRSLWDHLGFTTSTPAPTILVNDESKNCTAKLEVASAQLIEEVAYDKKLTTACVILAILDVGLVILCVWLCWTYKVWICGRRSTTTSSCSTQSFATSKAEEDDENEDEADAANREDHQDTSDTVNLV